jgi:hypothetical protein
MLLAGLDYQGRCGFQGSNESSGTSLRVLFARLRYWWSPVCGDWRCDNSHRKTLAIIDDEWVRFSISEWSTTSAQSTGCGEPRDERGLQTAGERVEEDGEVSHYF